MSRLRVALFALALGGAVACELIDPLDDISGGSGGKKSGTSASSSGSGSSSSGAADDDDDVVGASSSSSSGQSPFCPGTKESEPNETTPTPLVEGLMCGSLETQSDVDLWQFVNDTGTAMTTVLTVTADVDVTVTTTASSGAGNTSQISQTSGPAITQTLGPGTTLQVKISADAPFTGEDAYRLTFSGN
jgi:hypothetical protein